MNLPCTYKFRTGLSACYYNTISVLDNAGKIKRLYLANHMVRATSTFSDFMGPPLQATAALKYGW